MVETARIFIALGANLPFEARSPQATLSRALQLMPSRGVEVVCVSSFWMSPAWPDPEKPDYVNAVAQIATNKTPLELLETLLSIESSFGRRRNERWDSRTIDLDLLDFNRVTLTHARLTLPHPRLCDRAFVLLPLAEIASDWQHPVSGQSVSALVNALDQRLVSETVRTV
ncbi:MAG: 7,8-dihydro-6-hydroxymethylpterin-pyrophosphokina se [Hyphobacterium sp.]|nr:MAG: 7,8-dihydro-6-hydroxymethylpterin-pyrophosphokina se [Hyphobacterium sp.]